MSDQTNQNEGAAGQPNPSEGETGFGAAFAQRSNDPGKQQQTEDAGASTEAPTNEPSSDGSNEAPADAAAAGQDSGEAPAFDPYAGLTPEQRSHFQRLELQDKSNRGRISALQRKLIGSTATAPRAAPNNVEADGATEAGEGNEAKVSDLEKRLQESVTEYGEVLGPVAEILADVRAEIASMKGTVSAVQEELSAAEEAEAYEELASAHPDYNDTALITNFEAWLGSQPKQIVELANSFDPREVSLSLTLFKTERSAAIASQTGEGGDQQGQQASTATDTRRARQLEGNRSIPNRGAPAAAGTPNDFSSAFAARAKAKAS